MKVIRDLAGLDDGLRSGALAIGNFDGVHLGHARIMQRLVDAAREVGGPAIVLTFDPHPAWLLCPDRLPAPLTWTERKVELLGKLGVDGVIAYPTDMAFVELSPKEFFDQIICGQLDARALVEGPNFFFGHDRRGNVEVLGRLADEVGIGLSIVEPYELCGEFVSSSRVRRLIAEGDVALARGMLSEAYRIRGMVTHGTGRGAKLGFPTANVDAIDTLLPGEGVYAGRAWVQGQVWPAAVNIGPNPTFGEHVHKVEAHLVGRTEPFYGQTLEVDFWERLRDIHPFDSPEALAAQLERDVQATISIVEQIS